MFFRKKIEECGIRNGKMTENKKIKIGIISDTHGLLRTEVLDILQSCDCIFHAGDVDRPDRSPSVKGDFLNMKLRTEFINELLNESIMDDISFRSL